MVETGEKTARFHRPRWGTLALVVLFHLVALAGLVRAFAPDLTSTAIEKATSFVSVTVRTRPPPEPEVTPSPDPEPQPEQGAAAEQAQEAIAREVVAPEAPIPRPSSAPRASSTGNANLAGAGSEGAGTGAGGEGEGTGSGRAGSGQGGLPVTKPVKIAGDINDARDYPVPEGGRDERRGHEVIVYMTVGKDGRARDCRVVKPSPDPVADRITCELAEERFRFRPARDAEGNPVESTYGWRQRWF
ncbi:protein TonB [Altererythrobacter atlanticus]|uniref:Gram-negative bacterial tonB protein n=1 Tax=Croceibacterium atlanticum TaxID=1267766 RepID=A0A0F7KYG8_9SPHN|nr:energy transducer TonB [Croceibacterium atlanticum]AKH43860.1 Gram-negative bacterial tonB protein [Croceibacterium atlanticum]MBB5733690.1 protein TonB [Croceibacterium atlanticum]